MVTVVVYFSKRIPILVGLSLLLGFLGRALAVDKQSGAAEAFAVARVHFEHNATYGDVESLKSAYPEGVYTFAGATAAGQKFYGESTLNHKLPPPASFLRPGTGARGVNARDLEITWTPVKNSAAYIVEIEHDALNVKLTAKLPGSVTAFAVPDGFLAPGTQYELGIGTMSHEGNISFVETTFRTAGKE